MQNIKKIEEKFNIEVYGQKMPVMINIDKPRGFPKVLNLFGCKVGAEIGVNKGRFSKWMCHKIRPLKLFLVDPYKSYKEYSEYLDQNEMDSIYAEAQERVKRYDCEFVKKASMDALKDFNDESLDFVYIDGNHAYQYVLDDIRGWSKKVKVGGIVSGHDYSPYHFKNVVKAVDQYIKENNIRVWYRTKNSNWFFVKEE